MISIETVEKAPLSIQGRFAPLKLNNLKAKEERKMSVLGFFDRFNDNQYTR